MHYELSHFVLYFLLISAANFFTNRCVLYVFWYALFFPEAFTRFLLSYTILVGNLLRQNSLRIRKSTLYFLLTCLERAHSCLNTRASRTAISIPFNVFQYSFLPFLRTFFIRTIPYHVFALISYCLRYIFFLTYLSKHTCRWITIRFVIS